jgi:hypothetical protein
MKKGNSKSQAPSSKQIPNPKFQTNWNLALGIWNFPRRGLEFPSKRAEEGFQDETIPMVIGYWLLAIGP